MTINEVKNKCNEILAKANIKETLPVIVNGRLTRSLGRCMYGKARKGVIPIRLEFSKIFLETGTNESIINVIKHEVAHAIACYRTGLNQGHNEIFKSICTELDTPFDEPKAKVDRIVDDTKIYKYFVICEKCGSTVKYSRAGKTVKHPELYECKCGGRLKVIQNF